MYIYIYIIYIYIYIYIYIHLHGIIEKYVMTAITIKNQSIIRHALSLNCSTLSINN